MDVIAESPRLRLNVCDNAICLQYDVPCVTANAEYEERILQPAMSRSRE
jgi:hypothetical protein